jgi:VCBS repeat-containing protein
MTTDGSFTYQPDAGYQGPDTFTYTISDGTSYSEAATIHVDVLPAANRAPLATADRYAVAAGETLDVEAANGLLINDLDLDGDAIIASNYSTPGHGTVSLTTDGSFTYQPEAGYEGTDSFSYTARDEHGAYSASAEITITVTTPRNRAPVPQADWYYTPAGQALAVDAAEGILRNDLDPDGDGFIASNYSPPDHGSASMVVDGSFDYEPDPGFEGTDIITYTTRDDHGTYSTSSAEVRVLVGIYGDLPVGVLTPPTPGGFALQRPSPNPFNPRTEIAFRTEEDGHVQLRVLDLRGRTVATLVDADRPAGEHTVAWNGRDQAGARVASGTYVAELRRGGKRAVQKLTLVK